MMRASCVDLPKSAYKVLNGPYNWNRYPLAPLGCKAVIYKDGDTRGLCASTGVDGWYLGPSLDHYRCDLYYMPETWGYHILGSTELFPYHCQLPDLSPHQHLRALTDELTEGATETNNNTKGKQHLRMLRNRITAILSPPPSQEEQRVEVQLQHESEQRVINATPILTRPHLQSKIKESLKIVVETTCQPVLEDHDSFWLECKRRFLLATLVTKSFAFLFYCSGEIILPSIF